MSQKGTIKNETSAVVDVTSHSHSLSGNKLHMAFLILYRLPYDTILNLDSRTSSSRSCKTSPSTSFSTCPVNSLEVPDD
jgi:hypothetical protein